MLKRYTLCMHPEQVPQEIFIVTAGHVDNSTGNNDRLKLRHHSMSFVARRTLVHVVIWINPVRQIRHAHPDLLSTQNLGIKTFYH